MFASNWAVMITIMLELQESVTYKNGMTKKNPWKNIENFNNYYCKKYDFNIIE